MISIRELLQRHAVERGGKRAISDGSMSITYSELASLTESVAYAVSANCGNATTAVICGRDVYTPVAFFGALLAGKSYVPIDPSLPTSKLVSILLDSPPGLILNCADVAFDAAAAGYNGVVLDIRDCLSCSGEAADLRPSPEKTAYIIYTSGSTGKPKGVIKSLGSIEAFINAYCGAFHFSSNEIIGNQTPFFFDASAKDVYLSLYIGAELVIVPTELFMFPVKLVEFLNERRVSTICWVPSALSIVARLHTFDEIIPQYLKRVLFVGEVFKIRYLKDWMGALPRVEFINLYGSSEILGVCCFHRVSRSDLENDSLPIGVPFGNCRVYIYDNGTLTDKPNVPGEICVISDTLAKGYLNDPALTAAKFRELDTGVRKERALLTGDIGYFREDGRLMFSTRADYQIKHMGHRIELGEIETVALSLDGIDQCCCLYDAVKGSIIMYYSSAANMEAKEIKGILRGKLSEYMLPSRLIRLDSLPQNVNGKIDRASLQKLLNS